MLIFSDPATGWTQKSKRVGLICKKLGCTSDYNEFMEYMPLTILEVQDCHVTRVYEEQLPGKDIVPPHVMVELGGGKRNFSNATRYRIKQGLALGNRPPKRNFMTWIVSPDATIPVGTRVGAEHFVPGQYLDIRSKTKGKGFAGVMKRHGFKGLRATHGVSLTHRHGGSIGSRQDPGVVFKGKKMPGHLGQQFRTVKNVWLWKIDLHKNLLYVKGQVPGGTGELVRVSDAPGRRMMKPPPYPTYIRKPFERFPPEVTADSVQPDWWEEFFEDRLDVEFNAGNRAYDKDDPVWSSFVVNHFLEWTNKYPSYSKWRYGYLNEDGSQKAANTWNLQEKQELLAKVRSLKAQGVIGKGKKYKHI